MKSKEWLMLRKVLIISGVVILGVLLAWSAYHFYAKSQANSQSHEPGLLVVGRIVDEESGQSVRADVFLDDRIWARDVNSFEIFIWPGQSRKITVKAPGYKTWELVFTIPRVYSRRNIFTGPVRLKRVESQKVKV